MLCYHYISGVVGSRGKDTETGNTHGERHQGNGGGYFSRTIGKFLWDYHPDYTETREFFISKEHDWYEILLQHTESSDPTPEQKNAILQVIDPQQTFDTDAVVSIQKTIKNEIYIEVTGKTMAAMTYLCHSAREDIQRLRYEKNKNQNENKNEKNDIQEYFALEHLLLLYAAIDEKDNDEQKTGSHPITSKDFLHAYATYCEKFSTAFQ